MYNKPVDNYAQAHVFMHMNLSSIPIRLKKCVIKVSILLLLQYNFFLNAARLKKFVLKLLILALLYLTLFLIDINIYPISEDPFLLKYCHDRYKTQEIGDKAGNVFLPALKFVPDWFTTKKLTKNLNDDLFSNDDIILLMKILIMAHFFSDERSILSVDLGNVSFEKDDLKTVINVRLVAWCNTFLKKDIKKI